MVNLFSFESAEKKEARPERALVFVGGPKRACFLAGYGPGIESDLEAGLALDEIGPVPEAPVFSGLWIFEGTPLWREERSEGIVEGRVPEYHNRGTWRPPTPEEAERLCSGDLSQFISMSEEEG